MAPVPLILDVDTGVDDALALLYAVASPEVDLIAATCVMGNISVEQATENTLAVLEVAGRPEVEVAQGAARPLVRDHVPFPIVHGERGLGRAAPPPPSASPSSRSAVEMIVGSARERGDHFGRGERVHPDVGLGGRCDVAAAGERPAHQCEASEQLRQARLFTECESDVR